MGRITLVTASLLALLASSSPATAERKGHVTVAPCPHSCKTRGIPKPVCRDWKEGSACYVEDLTRPPGYTNNMPHRDPPATRYPIDRPTFPRDECNPRSAYGIAAPRVDIYSVRKTGNFFSEHYKVRGAIEGVCIEEAGYYERGRRKDTIPTVKSERFQRFEFEIKIRADEYPEIRAYNVRGDRDIYEIDPRRYDDRYDDRDRYDYYEGYRGTWRRP